MDGNKLYAEILDNFKNIRTEQKFLQAGIHTKNFPNQIKAIQSYFWITFWAKVLAISGKI